MSSGKRVRGLWRMVLIFSGSVLLAAAKLRADSGVPMERTDPFALTLDVSQGLVIDSNPHTPYRFSAKLAPELRNGNFGLGLLGTVRYSNPAWDFGGGLREEFLFWKVATDTGMRLVADETYWPQPDNFTIEGGLVADFSGLIRVGPWYGYDTQNHGSSIMFSAGFDLFPVLSILNPHNPEPNFNPHGRPISLTSGALQAATGSKKVALVVSGGGSTGAWALGAIKYMTQDKGIQFNMVCGTSTGSLISPLMVTGELDELLHIYTTVTTRDIFRMNSPSNIIAKNSAFTTSPLQGLIGKMITEERWEKIKASPMEMILTASCMQASQPAYFYTGIQDFQTGDTPAITGAIQDRDTLMRAMLASASDPVVCPMTHVPQDSKDQFSDGGVENFAPISVALLNGADVVYAVVLSPTVPDRVDGQFTDPVGTLQQTINMFANRVGQADVLQAQALAKQLGKKLVIIRPDKTITDNAQVFDPVLMKQWIVDGYDKAKQVLP